MKTIYTHTQTQREAGGHIDAQDTSSVKPNGSLCSALCNTRLHLTSTTTRTDWPRGGRRKRYCQTAVSMYLCGNSSIYVCVCGAYLLLINLTACAFAVPVTNATPGVASPAANAAADREREGKRSGG